MLLVRRSLLRRAQYLVRTIGPLACRTSLSSVAASSSPRSTPHHRKRGGFFCYDERKTFADLNIHGGLVEQLRTVGIRTPSRCQDAAIPHVFAHDTVVIGGETGSGKTLAYMLPVLSSLVRKAEREMQTEEDSGGSAAGMGVVDVDVEVDAEEFGRSDMRAEAEMRDVQLPFPEAVPLSKMHLYEKKQREMKAAKQGLARTAMQPRTVILVPRIELVQQVYNMAGRLCGAQDIVLRKLTGDTFTEQTRQFVREWTGRTDVLVTTPYFLSHLFKEYRDMPFHIECLVVDEADIMMVRNQSGGAFDSLKLVLSAFNSVEKQKLLAPDNHAIRRLPITKMVFAAATLGYRHVQMYLGYQNRVKGNKRTGKKATKKLLMKRFVDAKWVTTPLFHHKPPTVVEEWVHVYDRAHKHFHLLKSIAECGGAKYEDAGEDAVSKETRIQAMAALRARMVDDGDEFNSVYEGSEEMATLIDNANVARVIARVMSNQKQNTYARSAAATENESFWQREKRRKSQQIRFETFWEFSDENPFVNQTRTLIFCNRIDNAQYASSFLKNYGVENVVVHDTLPVAMRMQRLNAFRQGQINVLVCTDILARGADLDVDHVIMLDFSLNPMSYLHRLGRTGRAGRVGLCTNMYTQQDQALIESLTEADKHDGNYEAAGSFRKKKPNDTAPPSPSFTGARGLKVGQQQQQRQNNNNKRERAEQSERSVVSKTSGNVVDVY